MRKILALLALLLPSTLFAQTISVPSVRPGDFTAYQATVAQSTGSLQQQVNAITTSTSTADTVARSSCTDLYTRSYNNTAAIAAVALSTKVVTDNSAQWNVAYSSIPDLSNQAAVVKSSGPAWSLATVWQSTAQVQMGTNTTDIANLKVSTGNIFAQVSSTYTVLESSVTQLFTNDGNLSAADQTIRNATGTINVSLAAVAVSTGNIFAQVSSTYTVLESSVTTLFTNDANLSAADQAIRNSTTPVTTMGTQQSPGRTSNIAFTDNGNGTVNVSSGTGYFRTSNDPTAPIVVLNWAANTALAVPLDQTGYVYANYNGGSPNLTFSTTISRNSTSFPVGVLSRRENTIEIDPAGEFLPDANLATWARLAYRGVQHASGSVISSSGAMSVAVTAGVYFYGNNEVDTALTNSITTPIRLYRTTASSWTWSTVSSFANDVSGFDSGTGAITAFGAGAAHYGDFWMYQDMDGDLYAVYGRADYASLAAAQAGSAPTPPAHLSGFGTLIGQVVVQKAVTTALQSVSSAFTQTFQVSAVGVHNSLGGLQGGAANDYQHLTSAELTKVQNLPTTTTGFFVISSTDTNPGIQSSIINGSTINVTGVMAYTLENSPANADIVCNMVGRFTGQNTLNGNLTIPAGKTQSAVIPSTWTASKDFGLTFSIVSNTATVKTDAIQFNIYYFKVLGQ